MYITYYVVFKIHSEMFSATEFETKRYSRPAGFAGGKCRQGKSGSECSQIGEEHSEEEGGEGEGVESR